MATKKRTCVICGTQYEYCGHCPSKNLIEPWRNLYCSENCQKAFNILSDYKHNRIEAKEAMNKMKSWGLTPNIVKEIHRSLVSDMFDKAEKEIKKEEEILISKAEIKDEIVVEEVQSDSDEPKKKKKNKEEKIVNDN